MTAIQSKLQQLRASGRPVTDPFPLEIPLPDGGATMALPSIGAALFSAPGAAQAFEVQGPLLLAYTTHQGPLGALGYPESDEQAWYDMTSRLGMFQRGVITSSRELGTQIHADKVVQRLGMAAANGFALLNMASATSSSLVHTSEGVAAGTEWCGYTLSYLMRAAGLDRPHSTLFPSTLGLLCYGSYYTIDIYGNATARARVTKLLPSGQDIRDVHAARASLRKVTMWQQLQAGTPLDILPGDIVLVDSRAGGGPDHIQIVYRWHPAERVLTTIDGNGGSFALRSVLQQGNGNLQPNVHYRPTSSTPEPGTTVATATKQQYLQALDGLDVLWPMPQAGYVSVGCHVLTAAGQVNPPSQTSTTPHSRVFAIIRPSVVDFEAHTYQNV